MIFVTVSTGHFDPLIEACDHLSSKYPFLGQIGMSDASPSFPHFRTCSPLELETHMKAADIVISHGGTGMLSMLYHLKKRTVIVPKQIRYGESNNGQIELAEKWAQLGMGILCMDVEDLGRAIESCFQTHFSFPRLPLLGHVLAQHLGQS